MQSASRLKDLSPMGAAYHLEQLYESIRVDRMAGVPVLNDKIKVQAVGFRVWEGHALGVLITPWFMNLMLLPGESDEWRDLRIGSKHRFSFPAGSFEFIIGDEPGLGQYMSCSMFSPMFEFDSHAAAIATAEAIVPGLFEEDNKEVLTAERLGDEDADEEDSEDVKSLSGTLLEGMQLIGEATKKNIEKPLSRRDLLRGSLFRLNKNSDQEDAEKC